MIYENLEELAYTKLSYKFREGDNIKKILNLRVKFFNDIQTALYVIEKLKSIADSSGDALDEIGIFLGFPRPTIKAIEGDFMEYKVGAVEGKPYYVTGQEDYAPYLFDEDINVRKLTDVEYRTFLYVFAMLNTFKGTEDNYLKLFKIIFDYPIVIQDNPAELAAAIITVGGNPNTVQDNLIKSLSNIIEPLGIRFTYVFEKIVFTYSSNELLLLGSAYDRDIPYRSTE